MSGRDALRARRKKLKLTQQEAADLAGIPLVTYRSIEEGIRNPRMDTARKITDALKVSLDIFLMDESGSGRLIIVVTVAGVLLGLLLVNGIMQGVII